MVNVTRMNSKLNGCWAFSVGRLLARDETEETRARMSDQVLISKRLAVMLGYGVGDRISVYFIGEQVRVRKLVIAGLYDIQLEDMDERLALMDIRQVRRLNGWDEHDVSCLEISLGGDGGKAAALTAAAGWKITRVKRGVGSLWAYTTAVPV